MGQLEAKQEEKEVSDFTQTEIRLLHFTQPDTHTHASQVRGAKMENNMNFSFSQMNFGGRGADGWSVCVRSDNKVWSSEQASLRLTGGQVTAQDGD